MAAQVELIDAAQVAPVFSDPGMAEIYTGIASETITAGLALSIIAASGLLQLADENAAGEEEYRGIALTGGGAGAAIDYITHGCIYGFDLSSLDAEALVYLSQTAGELYDSDPGSAIVAGRVFRLSDASRTKVLMVDVRWHADWT